MPARFLPGFGCKAKPATLDPEGWESGGFVKGTLAYLLVVSSLPAVKGRGRGGCLVLTPSAS